VIWFTWRQVRTQTWIVAAILAALGALLVITGRSVNHAYETLVGACASNCGPAIDSFLREATTGLNGTAYGLAVPVLYGLPAVIGVFWGAPLLARELETGTYRMAWNQSITRTRWLAVKLAVVGVATVAAAGLLSWLVSAWATKVDLVNADRVTPQEFAIRGVVPIGYALFAFTLGVTVGMLIRRAVPAMAATLGVYFVAAFSVGEWIRANLVTPVETAVPLNTERIQWIMIGSDNNLTVSAFPDAEGWILSANTVTAAGQPFSAAPGTHECGDGTTFETCVNWLESQNLQQALSYHPDSHFWPLQFVEAGIFVGVAALLTGFCFWWVRRIS
jgi:hypothetical protein